MNHSDVVEGMTVVFNEDANSEYSVTTEGAVGVVVDKTDYAATVRVESDGQLYGVQAEFFDPIDASEVYGYDLPPISSHSFPASKTKLGSAKKKKAWSMDYDFDGEANFLVWTKHTSGSAPNEFLEKPCHGYMKKPENNGATLVYSQTGTTYTDEGLHPFTYKFYKWLKGSSPYASIFMNKTVKSMVEDGVWINTNAPSNLILGGLIATRYAWARSYMLNLMEKLVKKGISYHTSFIMAHIFYSKSNGGWGVYDGAPEEFSLNAVFVNKELLLNFHSHTMKNYNKPYKDSPVYKGVFGLWSGTFAERGKNYTASVTTILSTYNLSKSKEVEYDDWGRSGSTSMEHGMKDLVVFGLYLDKLVKDIDKGEG